MNKYHEFPQKDIQVPHKYPTSSPTSSPQVQVKCGIEAQGAAKPVSHLDPVLWVHTSTRAFSCYSAFSSQVAPTSVLRCHTRLEPTWRIWPASHGRCHCLPKVALAPALTDTGHAVTQKHNWSITFVLFLGLSKTKPLLRFPFGLCFLGDFFLPSRFL